MDLKFYLALFLRRLPYFLIFVTLGSALGVTLARILPPAAQCQPAERAPHLDVANPRHLRL